MNEESGSAGGLGRRLFLKGGAILGLLLGIPEAAWAIFIKNFPVRTVEKEGLKFDPQTGMVTTGPGETKTYELLVDGLVEEPASFPYAEIRDRPQAEQVSDFHCVEGWSVKDVRWGGFRFSEVIKRVKPLPEAKYSIFHSLGETGSKPGGLDHYVESFPIESLLDPDREIILALDLDGRPMPMDHGAPMRVISPYDLAYKSIKFVTRVELASAPREGWWTAANPIYPMDAPVPPGGLGGGLGSGFRLGFTKQVRRHKHARRRALSGVSLGLKL